MCCVQGRGQILLRGCAVLVWSAPTEPAGRRGAQTGMEKEKTAQPQQNRNFQFHIISWPITKHGDNDSCRQPRPPMAGPLLASKNNPSMIHFVASCNRNNTYTYYL